MKRLHSLFILALVVVSSRSTEFRCPPANEIYPCECRTRPYSSMSCDGVSSMESVRDTLRGHFEQPLSYLRLTNMHAFSLPPQALEEISPRKFAVSDSNIRVIDDNAFEGQHSLGLLILSEDRLEDIPTEALKPLTGLRTLSLTGNFLMKVQEGSLSNLTGLRFLMLSDNRISEIDKNAFPKSLQTLVLSRNLLSSLNRSLNHLQHLEELYATDNRLANIRGEFTELHALQHLSLDGNHISDVSDSFRDLTSLASLGLSRNRIQEVGKGLSALTRLRLLNLSRNYIVDLSWRVFEKMKELETLDLSRNYLKEVWLTLKPPRLLSDIYLSRLALDRFQSSSYPMRSLKRLDLSHNQLTSAEAVFLRPMPELSYLRLSHNRLTTATAGRELAAARNLQELDISSNNFSTLQLHDLDSYRKLVTLKIGGNPWKCTELLASVLEDLEHRGVDVQGSPACLLTTEQNHQNNIKDVTRTGYPLPTWI